MRPAHPVPAAASRPGRRTLLGGALAAAASVVAGCGVRLEDDAPAIPFIPTREPIPAETSLLWLLEDCRRLAAQGGTHAELYATQAAVLRSALFRAGVPIETLDEQPDPPGPTSPTDPPSPGTTAPTGTPTATPTTALGEGPAGPEAALLRVDELSGCGPGLFPLVMSLLAQRWAAVSLAGAATPQTAPSTDLTRMWRFPHLAAGFVELTHPAVYGFEIVTAQTSDDSRAAAAATLAALRLLRREQVIRAGGTAPDAPFGHPLPFPVEDEESALRLATHVLSGLTDGYGGLLRTVTGTAQQDTAEDVVGWLGAAAAHGARWGVPLAAFPGTRVPS